MSKTRKNNMKKKKIIYILIILQSSKIKYDEKILFIIRICITYGTLSN